MNHIKMSPTLSPIAGRQPAALPAAQQCEAELSVDAGFTLKVSTVQSA